jgi:pimeloyl-ACP methyl ester carboxylesterase
MAAGKPLRIFGRILIGSVALIGGALLFYQATHGRTPPIVNDRGQPIPGSIASLEWVELGGIKQAILLRGHSVHHPILLMLHGGPGMPQMHLAHSFQQPLERDFLVVQWDRRGAGKSYYGNIQRESLTTAQLMSDTFELVNYLHRRFADASLVLVGHSWGSYLGMHVVKQRPELFCAYVGVGQEAGSNQQNHLIQDRFIRDEAVARQEAQAIEELRRDPGSREKWLFRFGGEVRRMSSWLPLLWIGIKAPEYTLGDVRRLVKGLSLYSTAPAETQREALIDSITSVDLPIFFFTGRYDYTVPFELSERYLEKLKAPSKELVWFENSAHFPFLEEPVKFAVEMRRVGIHCERNGRNRSVK